MYFYKKYISLPINLSLIAPSPVGKIIPLINARRNTFMVSGFKDGYVLIEIKFLKVVWSHNIGLRMAVILWKRWVAEWTRLKGGGKSQDVVVYVNDQTHELTQRWHNVSLDFSGLFAIQWHHAWSEANNCECLIE